LNEIATKNGVKKPSNQAPKRKNSREEREPEQQEESRQESGEHPPEVETPTPEVIPQLPSEVPLATAPVELMVEPVEIDGNCNSVKKFQSHFDFQQVRTPPSLSFTAKFSPVVISGVYIPVTEDEKAEVAQVLQPAGKVVQTSTLLESASGSVLAVIFKACIPAQILVDVAIPLTSIHGKMETDLFVSLGFLVTKDGILNSHEFANNGILLMKSLTQVILDIKSLCTFYFPSMWRLYAQTAGKLLEPNPIAPFSELNVISNAIELDRLSSQAYPQSVNCFLVCGTFEGGEFSLTDLGLTFEVKPGDLFFFNSPLCGRKLFQQISGRWYLIHLSLHHQVVTVGRGVLDGTICN
jgi:hypothetical protein